MQLDVQPACTALGVLIVISLATYEEITGLQLHASPEETLDEASSEL